MNIKINYFCLKSKFQAFLYKTLIRHNKMTNLRCEKCQPKRCVVCTRPIRDVCEPMRIEYPYILYVPWSSRKINKISVK